LFRFVRSWDFDIITAAWSQTLTSSNELHGDWGSRAAEEPGSLNRIGIKNPAVDAMIDQIAFAQNRADLEAAARALDRILLWNHYVVPQWYYDKVRIARWDRFGHPDLMPKYGKAVLSGGGTSKKLQKQASCFSRAAGFGATSW
jgi:microcin C transport system substrate-binding protein